jgi:signal transduction histidine kinase
VGFEPDSARAGQGLTNLADRVAAAGGTVRIASSPGHGTEILGELPT